MVLYVLLGWLGPNFDAAARQGAVPRLCEAFNACSYFTGSGSSEGRGGATLLVAPGEVKGSANGRTVRLVAVH